MRSWPIQFVRLSLLIVRSASGRKSRAEWMLLCWQCVLWWADLVQNKGGQAFEFGGGAGADLESS